MCKEKNNNENDEEENKKAKNYIEQNDTYYETPKRSITTNVWLLSEHDCVSNNDIDDNISEISNSESNEACEFSSDYLPPSRSLFIKQKYCIDHGEIQINSHKFVFKIFQFQYY